MTLKALKTNKYYFNKPAFSLIEIMAVIMIVSLGLVGTVNLAVQNIKAQTLNEDNLIAYQLAQEALELARQIRDTNWMLGNNWLESLTPGRYCVDYRNVEILSINAVNDCPLSRDGNNFYFSPSIDDIADSVPSNFSRMIEIGSGTSSVPVLATVSWISRNGGIQNYTVATMFYDWY
ncbi:type II secretion system protein [Patescibacteria group bacterium]|nr:type II secretion system protein [Patescibacteria group bacterium]